MQIYNEDCVDFLKKQKSEIYDLIIADPPYFRLNGDFDFIWDNVDDYIEWSKSWIIECHRTLKSTGSFYLWGAMGYNKGFALPRIAHWIEKENLFIIRNWITQRNKRGRGNKKGYMMCREELVFATKGKDYTWNTSYTNEPSKRKDLGYNGKPRKNTHKRCSDVWVDITESSQSSHQRFDINGKNFPTVKSVDLCKRIIKASSNVGDLVYVPFGGAGSEVVVCKELDRKWVLTEICKDYIDKIIVPRLSRVKVPSRT